MSTLSDKELLEEAIHCATFGYPLNAKHGKALVQELLAKSMQVNTLQAQVRSLQRDLDGQRDVVEKLTAEVAR